MKNLLSSYHIRYIVSLWLFLGLTWAFSLPVLSQVKEHTFKISMGESSKETPVVINNKLTLINRVAQYDSLSAHHLYITESNLDNLPLNKTCFLFKGKRFNISSVDDYIAGKQLIKDGIQMVYGTNGLVESEKIYKQDIVQQQTSFYANGQKHMMISGDNQFLNGPFKMWHPNGQISFSGNYQNNLKEGVFESFDAAGNEERKGVYQQGKLIEGVAVVQDFVYDTPEVPAQYKGNDSILNKILIKKSANLADVVTMDSSAFKVLNLKFTIAKTGQIKNVDITNSSSPLHAQIIQSVFSRQFMDFQPAQMEGVAVNSYYNKRFYLTNKGLTTFNSDKDSLFIDEVYTIAEVMPEFPGGESGLRKFLAQTIRYPREATGKKIQGKVFVSFIILEDGTVSNVAIKQSAHPLLDAEALRVICKMPNWEPGRQDGKPVKVRYIIPINFITE